jgi:predicted RecB family endonuclease
MTFLVGLLASELGRKLALWGLIALSVLAIIARIYSAGKAAERARQAENSLKNLRERIKVDDEITKLSPSLRRERLRKWMSDD